MIAVLQETVPSRRSWQQAFDALLPEIMKCAQFALNGLRAERRDEALQDVLANCCVAFARLVEQGKTAQAFPSVLVRYAVRQHLGGRRVGNRLSVCDVLSPHARTQRQFKLQALESPDPQTGAWREAVIEDHKTCVADQAAFRIDFPAWLRTMSRRDRQIAEALSVGETTGAVAEKFGLSAARISRMRSDFCRSWSSFHGGERGECRDKVVGQA